MYYPKSQIQTGFYSNNTLAELATNKPYLGPYFNTSDGKSFSGKEPNDGPNLELIPLPNPNIKRKPTPSFDEGDELRNQDLRFLPYNARYSNIIGASRNEVPYSPISYYPILTQDDISNGEFTRFFVKKSNQNLYIEVSASNFNDSLSSPLYLQVPLVWVISGEKEKVREINAKQVAYVERLLDIVGLGAYLRFNYLQFYQDRVNLPNDFHIMPDGSIMEGKTHKDYLKTLTPVTNTQTSSSISPTSNTINRGGY